MMRITIAPKSGSSAAPVVFYALKFSGVWGWIVPQSFVFETPNHQACYWPADGRTITIEVADPADVPATFPVSSRVQV